MKKLLSVLPAFILLALIFGLSNCTTKTKPCDCCRAFGGSTVWYDTATGDSIKVPSAFTPSNLAFCDSNTLDINGNLTTAGCNANVDSIYNDKLNQSLYIEGIEKYPNNLLIIRDAGTDTTSIGRFTNYTNSKTRVFNGTTVDYTLHGTSRQRQLKSGRYKFILQIYGDAKHSLALRKDSIAGYFCLIRQMSFCNVGCEGHEKLDPLIK